METKLIILLSLAVCAQAWARAGSVLPDCIALADSVHAYLAHAQTRDRLTNISAEIKWATSLDTTDVTALRRIACGIEGRPATLVTKYFVESGTARYVIRRLYGYGIFLYRLYKQELENLVRTDPFNSVTAQVTRLGLRAIDAFDDRGFLCFDSPAVAEAKEKFSRVRYPYRPGQEPSCDEFEEMAEELLQLVEDNFSQYLTYVTQASGLHLADTENIGQFLCDIAEKDSFDGIVNVLASYGVFDHLIVTGLQVLPQTLGPVAEYAETASLTDDELKERYPYLRGASDEDIASFREDHRLAAEVDKYMQKLVTSIKTAPSEGERPSS